MTADHSDIPTRPATLAQLPFFASGRYPKPDLIGRCRPDSVEWTSGRELVPIVRDIALGLGEFGLQRGTCVALLSESRPEWLFTDLAVLSAGAVSTPIYPTLAAEQVAFILRDCAAEIVVVSTAEQLDKVLSVVKTVPHVRVIVSMDACERTAHGDVLIVTLDGVRTAGHNRIRGGWGIARQFHDHARLVRPDDLATIIYTSGTTAEPKGVRLTHGNLVANIQSALDVIALYETDVALSFLPLCHAFERIVAYIYLTSGVSVAFAESLDTVARDLQTVRPTVMTGVPRVFEKLRARIEERAQVASAPRRALFEWASRLAVRQGRALTGGRPLSLLDRAGLRLAERLVFTKIRAAVGGRLRFAVSGSAPLDDTLAAFFHGVGLPILEGYGLTETSPVLTVVPLERVRLGTVGPPLPNVDLRIADDGEVIVRGPNVMQGYHNRPEETAAVLVDGWFHTGDIGMLDEAGYLRLTDRKREIIVTSGGKKIAPQPIEQRLRRHPLVAEAIVVGDRRHFPAALLVPERTTLSRLLGRSLDVATGVYADPDVLAHYQAIVDEINTSLAQFERIKRFVLIDAELTIAGGMLTPTMKVKRRVIEERFAAQIEGLYRGTSSESEAGTPSPRPRRGAFR
jgi:long-chain acyl-CoA synthetase